MKKLNRKGVTLIELIVSFAIVGVAIIYFFQTLYTVKSIYSTARKETNNFIARDYALRIIDAYVDNVINEKNCITEADVEEMDLSNVCTYYNLNCSIKTQEETFNCDNCNSYFKAINGNNKVYRLYIKMNYDNSGKTYTTRFYKYINVEDSCQQ